MNKKMTVVALSAAFVGMGIAMPQCPGEKAMQQQIDTMQSDSMTLTRKIGALDAQVKTMNTDAATKQQLMTQLAAAVTAQKDALDRMDVAIKDLQAKVAASHSAKPAAKGKKHR